MPERRGRRRSVTPADILEVAKRHALEHGWRASRVQSIAADVGVSRPTLYNAYPSKQDLGVAILLDENAKFLAALASSLEGATSARQGLERGVLFALTEVDRNPMLAMILREDGGEGALCAAASVGPHTIIPMAVPLVSELLAPASPNASKARLAFVADTAVRLTLSHVLVPGNLPHEELAARIAALCMDILKAPSG